MGATAKAGTGAAGGAVDRRSLARLQAVQALYEILLSGNDAASVIADFKAGGRDFGTGEPDGASGPATVPDFELFERLVRTVVASADDLDAVIAAKMDDDRTGGARETLLALILRCGAAELRIAPGTPTAVIVNEWVDAAHAFYGGHEPALVNAVLDALAKDLRAPTP